MCCASTASQATLLSSRSTRRKSKRAAAQAHRTHGCSRLEAGMRPALVMMIAALLCLLCTQARADAVQKGARYSPVTTPRDLQYAVANGTQHVVVAAHMDMTEAGPPPNAQDAVMDSLVLRATKATASIRGHCTMEPFMVLDPPRLTGDQCLLLIVEDFLEQAGGEAGLWLHNLYVRINQEPPLHATLLNVRYSVIYLTSVAFVATGVRARAIDLTQHALYARDSVFYRFAKDVFSVVRMYSGTRLLFHNCSFVSNSAKTDNPQKVAIGPVAGLEDSDLQARPPLAWFHSCTFENNTADKPGEVSVSTKRSRVFSDRDLPRVYNEESSKDEPSWKLRNVASGDLEKLFFGQPFPTENDSNFVLFVQEQAEETGLPPVRRVLVPPLDQLTADAPHHQANRAQLVVMVTVICGVGFILVLALAIILHWVLRRKPEISDDDAKVRSDILLFQNGLGGSRGVHESWQEHSEDADDITMLTGQSTGLGPQTSLGPQSSKDSPVRSVAGVSPLSLPPAQPSAPPSVAGSFYSHYSSPRVTVPRAGSERGIMNSYGTGADDSRQSHHSSDGHEDNMSMHSSLSSSRGRIGVPQRSSGAILMPGGLMMPSLEQVALPMNSHPSQPMAPSLNSNGLPVLRGPSSAGALSGGALSVSALGASGLASVGSAVGPYLALDPVQEGTSEVSDLPQGLGAPSPSMNGRLMSELSLRSRVAAEAGVVSSQTGVDSWKDSRAPQLNTGASTYYASAHSFTGEPHSGGNSSLDGVRSFEQPMPTSSHSPQPPQAFVVAPSTTDQNRAAPTNAPKVPSSGRAVPVRFNNSVERQPLETMGTADTASRENSAGQGSTIDLHSATSPVSPAVLPAGAVTAAAPQPLAAPFVPEMDPRIRQEMRMPIAPAAVTHFFDCTVTVEAEDARFSHDKVVDTLEAIGASSLPYAQHYELLGAINQRLGGSCVVQFAESSALVDECTGEGKPVEVALKFHVKRTPYDRVCALFKDPVSRPLMPAVVEIIEQDSELMSAGHCVPPCVVVRRGETMEDWSTRTKPNLPTVLSALCELVVLLKDLHEAGFVYNNLKPTNVAWFRCKRKWELVDFGCTTCKGHSSGLGFSLNYAPPEVVSASEDSRDIMADPAADIWAIGIIAYELLSNKRTFPPGTTGAEIRSMITGKLPLPWEETEPRQLRTLRHSVLSCLVRNPEKRPSAVMLTSVWRNLLDFAAVSHTEVGR